MNSRPESPAGRGPASQHPRAGRPLRPLEILALGHVGALLVIASWAFGGGADWARTVIAGWGSLAMVVMIVAIRDRVARGDRVRQTLWWLSPMAAFNVVVLLSCLNPSFSERSFAGQSLLAHVGASHPWLPSTAHVPTSLEHLWLFDAIYLSCFNLMLAIRRRRALRILFLAIVANAVVLSVMGTFQKLASDGLYFGAVTAPNARFFATFVYGNHWAAYIVLLVGACLGLVFYYAQHPVSASASGSPLAIGFISLGLMGMTPLLAASRAGTMLMIALLGSAVIRACWQIRAHRRARGASALAPLLALGTCVLLAIGSAAYLGRGAMQERWHETQGQWKAGILGERLKLYADTWHLAAEQPVFGWGFGCYDKILQLTRPRPLELNRQYEHSYVDAHSDWLQSFAEVGIVGTLLLVLAVLWPLRSSRAMRFAGVLPAYLLGGCGLIVLYAAVEFPFGNPAVVIALWLCFFGAIQYVRLGSRSPASR